MKGNEKELSLAIGRNMQAIRESRGYSRPNIAKMLDLSKEAIQSYEKGYRVVGAARLWELSIIYNVRVEEFFYGKSENSC